jgi:ribosomal protein S18 acetylase RimI-like enzyme
MGPMITIRAGRPGDRDAAFDVWADSLTARDGRRPTSEVEAIVRQQLAAPGSVLLVATDGAAVVGMLSARDGAEDGGRGAPAPGLRHIDMLFVRPSHWGQGVGGKLLDAAVEASRALGYQRAQLWVVDENERATRLYARRGFRHTGRVTSGDHGEPIGLWAADLG